MLIITSAEPAAPQPKKVALLICSTRTPRVGPSISSYLSTLISSASDDENPRVTLTTVDLLPHISHLPISPNDTVIPAQQPRDNPKYSDPAVQSWSDLVASFDGFIFLTPQYNWSFPASIKVAIDHLFYEWAGKPAFIVSYGGRGGGKAAVALREVFNGLKMHGWEGKVELPLGEGVGSAVKGELDDNVVKRWEEAGKKEEVLKLWNEMANLLTSVA